MSTNKSHDPELKWLTYYTFWGLCFWVKLQQNELYGKWFFHFTLIGFQRTRNLWPFILPPILQSQKANWFILKKNHLINLKWVERKKVCSFDQKRLVFSGSKTIGHKYYAETKPQSNKIMFKFHVCLVP